MTYQAECDCGWKTTGDKDKVVQEGKAHGLEVHGFEPTTEQILAMSRPVEERRS